MPHALKKSERDREGGSMRNLVLALSLVGGGCSAVVEPDGATAELERERMSGTWSAFVSPCFARYTFDGDAYVHEMDCDDGRIEMERGTYEVLGDTVLFTPSGNVCGLTNVYALYLDNDVGDPVLDVEQPGTVQHAAVDEIDCEASQFEEALKIREGCSTVATWAECGITRR